MKTLLLILLLAPVAAIADPLSDSDTSALIARIAASRAGRTVQADFVESKTLPMWKSPVVEAGTIAFEPPNRFLRKTKNLVVCDGTTLWMYYPEFQQAEKYPLGGRGPGQIFAALGQALRFENLDEMFRVTATRLPDGFRIDLLPKSGMLRRMVRSLQIELDSSLRLRSSLLTGKEGDVAETKYSNEQQLPAGSLRFSFDPPASATVVAPFGEK